MSTRNKVILAVIVVVAIGAVVFGWSQLADAAVPNLTDDGGPSAARQREAIAPGGTMFSGDAEFESGAFGTGERLAR